VKIIYVDSKNMYAIKAIYDGSNFNLKEPVPVKGEYEVVITFVNPLEKKQEKRQNLLKYFGTWDDEDVETISEIIKERENFSLNRDEV